MKEKSPQDVRFIILLSAQVIIGLLILFAIFWQPLETEKDHLRTVGSHLVTVGLKEEGAKYYEKFLEQNGISSSTRSKIALSLGQIYESLGNLEKALGYYYLVTSNDEKKEASKQIVSLLERLNKTQSAQMELDALSSLNKEKPRSGDVVVAKVGDKSIFLKDINSAIDLLPKELKENYSKKEMKQEFIKRYVADELLYNKAQRLGFDRESTLTEKVELIKKQLLIQKVLETEMKDKLKVDEKDIKNFYKANESKYQKGKKSTSFESVKGEVERDYVQEKSQGIYEKLMEDNLKAKEVKLFLENVS